MLKGRQNERHDRLFGSGGTAVGKVVREGFSEVSLEGWKGRVM